MNKNKIISLCLTVLLGSGSLEAMNSLKETPDDDPQWLQDRLVNAAMFGDLDRVQKLLEKGADVNMTDTYGALPLIIATQNGHIKAIRLLRDHGANVNAHGRNGNFALGQAAILGRLKAVQALLTDIPAAEGRAMRESYFALARSMRAKKKELGTSPDTRRIILERFIAALVQQHIDTVVLPMIALQYSNGRTARDVALSYNYHAIADLLDLNNQKSMENIRAIVEANIRRAVKPKPIEVYPIAQGITWDEAFGTFEEPRE